MASGKVQKLIDEKLALHDLAEKVVDNKLMQRDAVHQLVMRKLTDMIEEPKKKRPLTEFLEKSKKKHEYSVVMAKGENADCPDCGKNIFNGKVFSGCVCFGDDMERKVFIKKEKDGIKVRFSKGWDEENIEMLLEVLRKKHG